MSKLLHTTNHSYTDYRSEYEDAKLGRGLLGEAGEERISPNELPSFISSEPMLLLRQTISLLDKVVQKRGSLRRMHLKAYVDRTKLAAALWERLLKVCAERGHKLEGDELSRLRKTWEWKVHPYAQHQVDDAMPERDDNGLELLTPHDTEISRADFEGRWHQVFWPAAGETVDYRAIADAMFEHLFTQERLIRGDVRRVGSVSGPDIGDPTNSGLIDARGEVVSNSVSNPVKPQKREKVTEWDEAIEEFYFESDIAAEIRASLNSVAETDQKVFASWFGSKLYDHFGRFKDNLPTEKPEREQVWALHNAIRQFYKKLAHSQKFRIALADARRDGDKAKLLQLLPLDAAGLLARIRGRKDNAEMSDLIRLGKIIVHAADLLHEGKPDQADFAKRMAYLATSDGQSEIKRIEGFARTWRKANGLALRTVKALADPKGEGVAAGNSGNMDIAAKPVAEWAYDNFDRHHFQSHIPILFGSKPMAAMGGRSRASIFDCDGDATAQKEVLWALIRLAAGVRNKVHHFNVRRHLLGQISDGILKPIADNVDAAVAQRNGAAARQAALSTFAELLDFDIAMRKDSIRQMLELVKAVEFVESDGLKRVVRELGRSESFKTLSVPRFGAVIHRIQDLADNDDVELDRELNIFVSAKLGASPEAEEPANKCRVSLLRELYGTGFRAWLSARCEDSEMYLKAVEKVVAAKNDRTDRALKRKRKKYRPITSVVEELGVASYKTLADLLKALTVQSMREARLDQAYNPNRSAQRDIGSRVEEFKQELFAHLFAAYLQDKTFGWIAEIAEPFTPEEDSMEKVLASFEGEEMAFDAAWHSQFYAWLYLVPPGDVSMLRHQIRKSVALEEKSNSPTDDAAIAIMQEMDLLMGLYTEVQASGFGDDEHVGALKLKGLFYENEAQFEEVYSSANEDHRASFPGTRRGLRQIARYAHLPVLSKIFEKHRITSAEVQAFISRDSAATKQLFSDRESLRKDIIKGATSRTPKEDAAWIDALPQNCARYRDVAIKVAAHNFQSNAARLTDHVRLHQMLLRIIGRLTDYTMIWERDRTFAFIGMLYRQSNGVGFELAMAGDDDRRVGLRLLDDDLKRRLLAQLQEVLSGKDYKPSKRQIADAKMGFIPILDEVNGFDAPLFIVSSALLKSEFAKTFAFRFLNAGPESKKDRTSRLLADAENRENRTPYERGDSRAQIRNDFAHQNVLDRKENKGGSMLRLSYLVNAVRSLMSYDRKLKNAVPQSVKRILAEEGLMVDWKMRDDRLMDAVIMPTVETHLTMVRPKAGQEDAVFELPHASIRLVSMATALFNFGSGGLRKEIGSGKKTFYPLAYPKEILGLHKRMPIDVLTATGIKSASESG